MQVDSIKAEMLGGFSVWVNGKVVVADAAKLTKPWQLFCYLLLHREKFVSNRKLISALWADDMLTDPANVLKNAVYSLRKELCGGESLTDSPVIYSTGGYRFDPGVELELDVSHFSDLCARANDATDNPDLRIALCQEAVEAYKGEFLPQLDQDLWAVPLALEYRRKYLECAHDLCESLWLKKEYKELLELASVAIGCEPLDERTNVYLFRAMDAMKMYRAIVTTFSRTAQRYEDTLGAEPPDEVRRVYHAASERINKTEQDVIVIKTELAGSEQAVRPQRGAYFCSYSNLRHMYGLMKRAAERNSLVLVLALFTISPGKGAASNQYDLVRTMAEFKVVAMNNLRKADALARYSRNQYVMLLSVNSLEDGRLIRDRIRESFAATPASRQLAVDVKLTEV
jgi:DNA-binding SARP family transcriptional activator